MTAESISVSFPYQGGFVHALSTSPSDLVLFKSKTPEVGLMTLIAGRTPSGTVVNSVEFARMNDVPLPVRQLIVAAQTHAFPAVGVTKTFTATELETGSVEPPRIEVLNQKTYRDPVLEPVQASLDRQVRKIERASKRGGRHSEERQFRVSESVVEAAQQTSIALTRLGFETPSAITEIADARLVMQGTLYESLVVTAGSSKTPSREASPSRELAGPSSGMGI